MLAVIFNDKHSNLAIVLILSLLCATLNGADRAWADDTRDGFVDVAGGRYKLDSDNEYMIAKNLPSTIRSVRVDSQQDTDCEPIMERIRRDERNIARCTGTSRPTAVCELLSDSLRREILGIRNDAMGTFDPDVIQRWEIKAEMDHGSSAPGSVAGLELQIAQLLRLSASQVKVAGNAGIHFEDATLQAKPESLSSRLEAAGFQWAKPSSRFLTEGGQPLIETRNRLVTCELQTGAIKIASHLVLSHAWQVPADRESLQSEWKVHEDLHQAMQRPGVTLRRKFVLAGYMLSESAKQHGLNLDEDSIFWAVASRHILLDGPASPADQPILRTYENYFALGRAVLQVDRQGSMRVSVANSPFVAPNQ